MEAKDKKAGIIFEKTRRDFRGAGTPWRYLTGPERLEAVMAKPLDRDDRQGRLTLAARQDDADSNDRPE